MAKVLSSRLGFQIKAPVCSTAEEEGISIMDVSALRESRGDRSRL